jgi:diguanylate cyclase (GGDEF)-like protein
LAKPGRGTTQLEYGSILEEDARPTVGHALLARVRRVPPAARVAVFSVVLAAVAAGLFLGYLVHQAEPLVPPGLLVPWWAVAAAFVVTELKVVDVHFRREKHSFSLSEVPAVVGFFLLSPTDCFLAMLAGTTVALLWSRTGPLKLAFNLANFMFVAAVGMSVFYALGGPVPDPDMRAWAAAFAGTMTAAALSALTIASAISMSGGAPQFQKLVEMIQFGELVAVANTSLALLVVAILWVEPRLLVLLIVPIVAMYLAYRAYVSEREKHQRLELLYQSSRILQHSPELDSALGALLEHAREMFRAERAEVLLWPRDSSDEGLMTSARHDGDLETMVATPIPAVHELHRRIGHERRAVLHVAPARRDDAIHHAMAVPLLGESGLIGSMVIANRLTEGTQFSPDDLRLLETLANQAAVALENGQLEQSLSELSRLKEELRFQAYHDPLTGLGNRTLFTNRVDEALGAPGEDQIPVVLFLDLDNFKDVNDSLGHAAGDRLLVAVAERVRASIRSNDLAARLGGDEFAILLSDGRDLASSLAVANRIIESLAITFPIQGQDIKISASIGIAASHGTGERADDLLRNADVAMYTAKQGGKSRVSVFEPSMHEAIVARHVMTSELSRGIAGGEIDVFYQPLITLASGAAYGAEALARWRHPTRGVIPPDDFIPLAEESGAIMALGHAVLFEACREAARWRSDDKTPLTLTVNLSATQLAHDAFVPDLVDILRATGLPPSRLVLEMTESAMFHDTQTTISRLTALRDLGIRVALDDFGTGYSSLGYLRRFPVDMLKIAREFVVPDGADPGGWAFASAIVALGRTLDLRIVAEGIEAPGQLEQLRTMGCELGQGFLFARPMSGEETASRFAAQRGTPWVEPAMPAVPIRLVPRTA